MQINLKTFLELDTNKKNAEWADTIVSHLRMYMKPIVSEKRYDDNMAMLRGEHKMDSVRKLFKEPDKAGTSFIPLAVMEKMRNVIIAENENAGINIKLTAVDPTATNQRQKDKELLANRQMIEAGMSALSQPIGLPPFSLKAEKGKDGKGLFNGDVEGFDKMGLDDSSAEDIDYFFSTFYRLLHEMDAEKAVNYFVAYNELTEMIAPFVNDILAVKRVACQAYVDEVDGLIKYRYLCPKNVKAIRGKRRDYKDSPAMCFEQEMSVGEFIKMMGNSFDYKQDMPALLQAANQANGKAYTCVCDKSGAVYVGKWGDSVEYSQFLELTVVVGYVEWKSIDMESYKITQSNSFGNTAMFPVRNDRVVTDESAYEMESWYNEVTYKSYYLIQTGDTQRLFKYGKLSYQVTEGSEDEYSNFSICAYAEWGKSATEVAAPYIENIQKAWAKFEHMIAAAKPPGRSYNYDSLVKIAKHMFPEAGVEVGVDSVMKMFFDGINEIWTIPTTDDGQPIGGSGQSSYELPNGLSKAVGELKGVIDYNFAQINEMLGISNLRDAGSPNPREGYKLSMQALEYSHNATQYVRSALLNTCNNIAKRTLSFVQDIIRFRSKNSVPYKALLTALGDEVVTNIDTLGDVMLHRYGIFVEALNTQYEREGIRQMAMQASANKEIEYHQLLLVTSVKSPKEAAKILSYEKKRTERVQARLKQADYEHLQAMEQLKNQRELGIANAKMQESLAVADRTGMWLYKVKELEVNAQIKKQSIKTDGEPDLIAARTQGRITEMTSEADLEAQKPLVA